jgi:hypothetical protein
MSDLDYIGAGELVFNNDQENGIHSGGFSVNSILMKAGMSPIMTLNTEQFGGKTDKVSDLFNDLVIPNWTLSYNNRIIGGKNDIEKRLNNDSDSDEDDVIHDDLHNKLLELVEQHNISVKNSKKKMTRKNKKNNVKKGITKRNIKKQ